MGLLDILRQTEFRLQDKQFEKLTMEEAKMTQWISLDHPREIYPLMASLFGEDWRQLPFKSACEILQFRFGDTFIVPDRPFGYDTWNPLMYLGQKLNAAQKDFLRQHHFLPHRYVSMKEERDVLLQKQKSLGIAIVELTASKGDEQRAIKEQELEKVTARVEELDANIEKWEQENPFGGNPAEATEYLRDDLELKEWLINNQEAAQGKTMMFGIITGQMKQALAQFRGGRQILAQDFGHYEEQVKRKEEADKQSNREWKQKQKELKRQQKENKKKGIVVQPSGKKDDLKPGEIRTMRSSGGSNTRRSGYGEGVNFGFSGHVKPPEAKFKIAVSTKVKVREPEDNEVVVSAAEPVTQAPEPRKQTFSEILKEQENKKKQAETPNDSQESAEQEATSGSYEDIRRRMMEKKEKGEELNVKSSSKKPKSFMKVAVGVIIALAIAALVYALM